MFLHVKSTSRQHKLDIFLPSNCRIVSNYICCDILPTCCTFQAQTKWLVWLGKQNPLPILSCLSYHFILISLLFPYYQPLGETNVINALNPQKFGSECKSSAHSGWLSCQLWYSAEASRWTHWCNKQQPWTPGCWKPIVHNTQFKLCSLYQLGCLGMQQPQWLSLPQRDNSACSVAAANPSRVWSSLWNSKVPSPDQPHIAMFPKNKFCIPCTKNPRPHQPSWPWEQKKEFSTTPSKGSFNQLLSAHFAFFLTSNHLSTLGMQFLKFHFDIQNLL